MSTTEADVQIILNAQDRATEVIEDSTKRINRAYRQMRNEQRAVERQFEINNRTFVQTGRILGSLGSIVNRARGLYNTFLLQQIRNEQTARNLRDAQKDLNLAIAEFGPNSREAIDAHEEVTRTLKDQERQMQENILAWVFTIGVLLNSVPTINRVIGRFKALGVAQKFGLGGKGTTTVPKSPTSSLTGTKPTPKGGVGGKLGGGIGGAAGAGAIGFALAFGESIIDSILAAAGDEGAQKRIKGRQRLEERLTEVANAASGNTITININSTSSQDLIQKIAEAARNGQTYSVGIE